jgi:hypothetical protein
MIPALGGPERRVAEGLRVTADGPRPGGLETASCSISRLARRPCPLPSM